MRHFRWVLAALAVAALVLIGAEVGLMILIGSQIGWWWVLGIIIATAVLGAVLMNLEGRKAWRALAGAFGSGRMPSGELADAALVLLGGMLLIGPGFISDATGLLLLLPITRPAARSLVAFVIARMVPRPPTSVIEGEVVDDPQDGHDDDPPVIRGEIV